MSAPFETAIKYMAQNTFDNKPTYIGSDNGLVPSGNKPLPELMLTQMYVAIMASPVYNNLAINRHALILLNWAF